MYNILLLIIGAAAVLLAVVVYLAEKIDKLLSMSPYRQALRRHKRRRAA